MTALVLVSAVVVVVEGLVHRSSSGADGLDRTISAALWTIWPAPGAFAYAVDGLVTLVPIVLTVAVLGAASVLSRQRRLIVLVLLGPFGVVAATTVLKPLVGRTIHGENLSFPSGHTGYATAIGLLLGFLVVGLARPSRRGWALVALLLPALATGCFMAVDQIVLDAHYPSDTLGGFCTAVTVICTLALLVDLVADRWEIRSGPREDGPPPSTVRRRQGSRPAGPASPRRP